jgi:hypothetical protein
MSIKASYSRARQNLAFIWNAVDSSREPAILERRGRGDMALRVSALMKVARRDPFRGIGKPEPLKQLGPDICLLISEGRRASTLALPPGFIRQPSKSLTKNLSLGQAGLLRDHSDGQRVQINSTPHPLPVRLNSAGIWARPAYASMPATSSMPNSWS